MRRTQVNFGKTIRDWDGFGVNYVEVAQTRDYQADPQEYGGFSIMSEEDRQAVIELVFGDDGLLPGVVKMFQDSFQQAEPGDGYALNAYSIDLDAYDHETTTQWMRYFVREGVKRVRERGGDLDVIVTLYGPPAWTTLQRIVRGRDIDPALKVEVAKYLIAFAKFLKEEEGLTVKYLSVHNEGEDWMRWPEDGTEGGLNHDYNMYWPPEQVVAFMKLIPEILEANGLGEMSPTPGETSNWYRFAEYGYADALANDVEAAQKLGLITSHGFKGAAVGRWRGDWRSVGIDTIRAVNPGLHTWVTSTSWSKMDVFFVDEIRNNIYCAKVNAIIPWACIQRPGKWVGGDPNPGCAFRVYDDGSYEVMPGYYFFKQVSRAGQPGMRIAQVVSNDPEIGVMGFASNGTDNPDAFVVLNMSQESKALTIDLAGTITTTFEAFRTGPDEQYVSLGEFTLEDGTFAYDAPAGSVTTWFAK